jgi:hypothetical protein
LIGLLLEKVGQVKVIFVFQEQEICQSIAFACVFLSTSWWSYPFVPSCPSESSLEEELRSQNPMGLAVCTVFAVTPITV